MRRLIADQRQAAHLRQYGNAHAVAGIKAKADEKANELRGLIESIKAEGITTLAGIAEALTRRRVLTPRGKDKWHITTVVNLLGRLEA